MTITQKSKLQGLARPAGRSFSCGLGSTWPARLRIAGLCLCQCLAEGLALATGLRLGESLCSITRETITAYKSSSTMH
jgi:hypothetical protein